MYNNSNTHSDHVYNNLTLTHTVCLETVIYFVGKRPGCTEWHQISLSAVQSRYIIQKWNNRNEHRSKTCRSLGVTLACVNRELQKSIRWPCGPQACRLGVHRADQSCLILLFYSHDRRLCFFALPSPSLFGNTIVTKIK